MEVVFAVDEGPAEDREVVSVGEVARRLGVDSSQGSRLVARAVSAGYLRRTAQQEDGRRSGLVLTDRGREIADAAHRRRQSYYLELMEGWSEGERRTLADLLTRLTEAMPR
jgi:DNA-binding MarR family transcriptional regulator